MTGQQFLADRNRIWSDKMSENVMLDVNAIKKSVSKIEKLNSDRYHMQAVYQKKSPAYLRSKRGMDILLSTAALVCLAPVFLITALAIKLEDGGPVLFS